MEETAKEETTRPNICTSSMPLLAMKILQVGRSVGNSFDVLRYSELKNNVYDLTEEEGEELEQLEALSGQFLSSRSLQKLYRDRNHLVIGQWLKVNSSLEIGNEFLDKLNRVLNEWRNREDLAREYIAENAEQYHYMARDCFPLEIINQLFPEMQYLSRLEVSKLNDADRDIHSKFYKTSLGGLLIDLAKYVEVTARVVQEKFERQDTGARADSGLVSSANDERDKWLRSQKEAGELTLSQIRGKLKREFKHWTPLSNDSSLNSAITRYEKRKNLSPLPKRKSNS